MSPIALADITRYGIGTATWLELSWLLVGAAGLFNIYMLFLAALGDWSFLRREGINGTRSIVAKSSCVTLGAKVVVVSGYTVVGIVASASAPANPNQPIRWASVAVTVAFLLGTLALNGAALYQRIARNRVLEIEAERDRHHRWDGIDRRALEQ